MSDANLERFGDFADLYDAVRPAPPDVFGSLLCAYAGTRRPAVADLGSGSGLSTRWAARWAGSVVGVEPDDGMRAVAESRSVPGVTYRKGVAHDTGLASGSVDVVVIVQALHWMDPAPTLAEIARILRPGGVVAACDADWPPVGGRARAEAAWETLDRRFRVFEDRAAAGATGAALAQPVDDAGLGPGTGEVPGTAGRRDRSGGVRSWDKRGHLGRMEASGHFAYTRELVAFEPAEGGPERFMGLLRSQGTYQQLRRLGMTEAELGVDRFEAEVIAAYGGGEGAFGFCWRARLGIAPPL